MDNTGIAVQKIIDEMVFRLGLTSENQLCEFLEITQGAISKWKARGSVPMKYQKQVDEVVAARKEAAEVVSKVSVSTSEVSQALGMTGEKSIYKFRSKNPYLYALIENGIKLEKISGINRAIKMKR